jgi:hypothetical protein
MTGDATPVKFNLSAGNTSDAKECPLLLESIGEHEGTLLLMDRAYEDNKTRAFAETRFCSRRAAEAQLQRAVGLRPRIVQTAKRRAFLPPCVHPLRQARRYVQRIHLSG